MNRAVIALAVALGCGSKEPAGFRLQMSGGDTTGGARPATLTLEGGQTRTVELIVVGSTPAPVTFSGQNLPAFATLDGPLLTISPARTDKGAYDLTVVASSGDQSASSVLRVIVSRSNSAPQASVAFWDNLAHYENVCPNPVLCTVTGAPRLALSACDPEGDGLRFEAEVAPADQVFSGIPTFSAFVSASDPSRTADSSGKSGTCGGTDFILSGLMPEQSYHFAVRIVDGFGAVASFGYSSGDAKIGADGWATSDRWGFDQGPCTDRRCACLPSGFEPCLESSECCSGVCAPDQHGWPTCQPCTPEQHCACLPSGHGPCLANSDCCSGKCVPFTFGGTTCQ
jgi:hypothetical protein